MSDTRPLDPFAMLKAITREKGFTPAEARFLANHVLHTDNATRKVRHSIRATAEEVGVDRKVGERAIKKAHERGYLTTSKPYRNSRGQTVKDVWFHPYAPAAEVRETPGDRMKSSVTTAEGSHAPGESLEHRGRDEGSDAPPSTTSTPVTPEDEMKYPCFDCGLVDCTCTTEAMVTCDTSRRVRGLGFLSHPTGVGVLM